MSASTKTKKLLRLDLPLDLLVKNTRNPNKMSDREFDLLVDNLERTGFTDPILCWPEKLDLVQAVVEATDKASLVATLIESDLKFKIIGGHHRFDAAQYLGFDTVPCTIIMEPEFDEEQSTFQTVRMNAIRGKLDPQKFFDLYNQLSSKYADDILQESFGFADEAEFKKLINQLAKTLPDASLQKKFKEAAAEVKTIEGLSKLLNEMFSKFGDTLPFGYMTFDYGGQRSVWLRCEKKTINALEVVGHLCVDNHRTMDDVIGGLVQLIAKGELKETVAKIIAKTDPVELPEGFTGLATKDNIDKVKAEL